MCSIIDYVKEKGNESFEIRPFGSVDALVLSQLSYIHWENFVPRIREGRKVPLRFFQVGKGCPDKMYCLFRSTGFDSENRRLLHAVARSRRFANVEVEFFEEETDICENKQFCGVTFRISGHLSCVVFRGTDNSMNGWKENFSMLYRYPVPAQICARNYLESVSRRIRSKLVVCGHSKGGNLAVYAAAMSTPETKNKIRRIYNFDGPGFQDGFFELPEFMDISDRIRKYVVPESYVGLLLYNRGPEYVVESNASGMAQHDTFQWEVDACRLARSHSFNRNKRLEGKRLNERILALSGPKAKIVVDSFFDASRDGNIVDITQINGEYVIQVLKTLSEKNSLDLDSIGILKDMVLYMMTGKPKRVARTRRRG